MKTIILSFLITLSVASATDNANKVFIYSIFNKIFYTASRNEGATLLIRAEYSESSDINAYATFDDKYSNGYIVIVTRGILDSVIKGNEDALALVIGHEIAHITRGHLNKFSKKSTNYKLQIFSRSDEYEADTVGLKYAIGSGYSFKKAKIFIQSLIDFGYEYTSFEGISENHPSWKERLVYLDKEKSHLWKSMVSFKNGVYFLNIEQYVPAEYCFRSVIKEFPDCSEAYANLGYSLLMQYCDGLDESDILRFGIGQLVTGAFYKRPQSLENAVRGINEDLWWDAVGHLRESIRMNQNLTLSYSNLGIAYLISPNGRDLKNSIKYFEKSLELAGKDSTLDDFAKSALYINYGISFLSGNNFKKANEQIIIADNLIRSNFMSNKRQITTSNALFNGAINYNIALILSKGNKQDQKKSLKFFEDYLIRTNHSSIWWSIALKEYKTLCENSNTQPKKFNNLNLRSVYKPVISVSLGEETIFLSDEKESTLSKLSNNRLFKFKISRGTNLDKYVDTFNQIELITSDKLLSVFLIGENSPPVSIETNSIPSTKTIIHIGMEITDFNKAIKGEEDNYNFTKILDNNKSYRYYLNLGLAIKIDKEKKTISEIVIIQIPYS